VIDMPEAVAAPWPAWPATATEVAAPPDRTRVTGLAELSAATVIETGPATGAARAAGAITTV
jgi:hypothetical protein